MRVGFNFQPDSRIRGAATQSSGAEQLRADIWGTAHKSSLAVAGRMNTFDFAPPGSKPQADGTYALDLLADKDARTLTFQEADGMVGAIQISQRIQELGWPAGDYYMLETDSTGKVVVEPGRNHRKVYISAGPDGMSRAQIAADAGVAEAAVTNAWLLAGAGLKYATEAKPLNRDVGYSFLKSINTPSSFWFLFKGGYDYSEGVEGTRPPEGMRGESPIHPVVYGAWGTGEPIGVDVVTTSYHLSHVVIRDQREVTVKSAAGWNWLVTDIVNTKHGLDSSSDANGMDGLTYYRTVIHDLHRDTPKNGVSWSSSVDRISATFLNNVNGMLMWQYVADYIGWREGYHPDLLWNNGEFPMPPSALTQGIYVQWNCRDVGSFENVSARAASVGQQLRSGGYSVDNLFIDNNISNSDLGGDYKYRGPVGSWSVHHGTITTSAGYRDANGAGSLALGVDLNNPYLPVAVDVIQMHMADPNNPTEIAAKPKAGADIRNSATRGWYELNAITYNWGDTSRNIDGLDAEVMNQTTLQLYAEAKLGAGNGTIKKYLEYFRALTPAQRKTEADDLRAFFRAPIQAKLTDTPVARTAAATCTFKADDRTEGFRWDIRMNWDTKDIPGAKFKDNVNLFGNRVKFGRYTASVGDLTFGTGGRLEVSSGKLGVDNQIGTADVTVFNCGQYNAQAEAGIYRARGGRLVLRPTGTPEAFSVEASGDAECLFGNPKAAIAQAVTIAAGQTLRIDGGQCFVGVDGLSNATRTLTIAGTLDIRSTPIVRVARDHISPRYKQGQALNGQTSGFSGILDCMQFMTGGWNIAVRGLSGTPVVGEQMVGDPLITGGSGSDPEDDVTGGELVATRRIPVVAAIQAATLPCIREFRSGANGEAAPSVNFTVALSGPLKLDLTGIAAGTYPLIEADSITGSFSSQTINRLSAGLTATVNKTATKVEVVVATA